MLIQSSPYGAIINSVFSKKIQYKSIIAEEVRVRRSPERRCAWRRWQRRGVDAAGRRAGAAAGGSARWARARLPAWQARSGARPQAPAGAARSTWRPGSARAARAARAVRRGPCRSPCGSRPTRRHQAAGSARRAASPDSRGSSMCSTPNTNSQTIQYSTNSGLWIAFAIQCWPAGPQVIVKNHVIYLLTYTKYVLYEYMFIYAIVPRRTSSSRAYRPRCRTSCRLRGRAQESACPVLYTLYNILNI